MSKEVKHVEEKNKLETVETELKKQGVTEETKEKKIEEKGNKAEKNQIDTSQKIEEETPQKIRDTSSEEKEKKSEHDKVEIKLSSWIKNKIESGLDMLTNPEKGLKGIVQDFTFPKEIGGYILDQIDETKNAILKVFARELREFLENTDIVAAMTKVLTSISFEIKTEVRFKSKNQDEENVTKNDGKRGGQRKS